MTKQEKNAVQEIKDNIARQWNYLGEEEIDTCYNYALADYINIKYRISSAKPTPENLTYDFTTLNWLSVRMRDILSRAGGLNASSYRENGLNITYGASYIDPQLVAMILPKAGLPL